MIETMFVNIILLSLFICDSFSARILGIVPAPCYSHQIVFQALWKELSLRGHHLTIISTYPMNDSTLVNLTEINVQSTCKNWNELNLFEISQSTFEIVTTGLNTVEDLIDAQLTHPDVKNLIRSKTEHFDLLIVESIFPAMFAFSYKFNCPLILMTSMDASIRNYDLIENPSHPVASPDFLLPYIENLTFLERVASTIYLISLRIINTLYIFPKHDSLVKKHFGVDYPSVKDIGKNLSLMFVNTNPFFHQIKPLLPSVIQIGGGIHIKPQQSLPKHLEAILNEAPEGFIYFSLGSLQGLKLPENVRQTFLDTFSELPYKILWKDDNDALKRPANVFISHWFPQQDLLRHPGIQLFITTGGLQSIEEAIYFEIPMVGMAFVGDELNNINRLVAKGFGLSVNYKTLDKNLLKSTILEVINNPRYRQRVREVSELIKDQPMTGLERAVWWTEYVIRHKGAQHFQSPAVNLPSYQYYLLDVMFFCLLITLIFIKITHTCVKRIIVKKPKQKVQ